MSAPNTSLPNPFNVMVPSGVRYDSREAETAGGDDVFIMRLLWDLHPDAFVQQFGDFELQYKLSADDEWFPSFFVDGSLTQTDVFTSSAGVFYDIRIRARNNLGVRSGWVTIFNAFVGSSGGVTASFDYEFVNDAVSVFLDYGGVADAVSVTEDYGLVQ